MGKKEKVKELFETVFSEKLNMDDYNHRLKIQKLTYMAQTAGFGFDYCFNWYLKGPYSALLTKHGFDARAKEDKSSRDIFSKNEKKIVKLLKKEFKEYFKEPRTAELIGSTLYLYKTEKKSDVLDRMMRLKPWYKENEINKAISKIEKSKLFKSS